MQRPIFYSTERYVIQRQMAENKHALTGPARNRGRQCCFINCHTYQGDPGITIHRVPTDQARLVVIFEVNSDETT